jgi:hypothetical protein
MEYQVDPEKRFKSNPKEDELGIRITVFISGSSKSDRRKLRQLWERIEDSDELSTLLEVVEAAGKGKIPPYL